MGLLSSLKILDFSGLLPGPYATMLLADLGAEVLRVESPSRPDLVREMPPFDGENSAAHNYLNRSKRAITLDLKQPESIDIVKRLVQKYDIVLEQFRPGVMERLGLGYELLKKENPSLIYCSLTGYGRTGPMRTRAGHDNNYLSIAGITGYTGRKGSGPLPLGFQAADIAGGSLHAVISILAAVHYREQSGEGMDIDLSMTDAVFAMNAMHGAGFLACGVEPKPESMLLNGGTFYDYYQTKDGRYFSVGSLEPHFRQQLCEGIGQPELYELSMSANPADVRSFKEAVRTAFQSKTFDQWLEIFNGLDCCVEPVLNLSEACEHPQLKARNMIVDVPKENGMTQRQIAFPVKFSGFTPEYKHVGAKTGANTEEVLTDLGFSTQEIGDLARRGII